MTGVLNGDTVDVLVDLKPVRVRLEEIDAPGKAQPWGTRSRQALSGVGRLVKCDACPYGATGATSVRRCSQPAKELTGQNRTFTCAAEFGHKQTYTVTAQFVSRFFIQQ